MSNLMNWNTVRHFAPEEFSYPDKLNPDAVYLLDTMRHVEDGIIITINSDYRPGDPRTHGQGIAFDIVIRAARTKQALPVLHQWIVALRYPWGGIGFYTGWNTPGLHVDKRPFSRRALWWSPAPGEYKSVESYFC